MFLFALTTGMSGVSVKTCNEDGKFIKSFAWRYIAVKVTELSSAMKIFHEYDDILDLNTDDV